MLKQSFLTAQINGIQRDERTALYQIVPQTFNPFLIARSVYLIIGIRLRALVIGRYKQVGYIGQSAHAVHIGNSAFLTHLALGIIDDLQQLFALPVKRLAVKQHVHRFTNIVYGAHWNTFVGGYSLIECFHGALVVVVQPLVQQLVAVHGGQI